MQKSLQAAVQMEQQNPRHDVEVIDLRSLSPYDWEAIRASVEKTSRVMIVHEDTLSWGYGAEISARIARELFGSLDAPVGRVGRARHMGRLHSSARKRDSAAGGEHRRRSHTHPGVLGRKSDAPAQRLAPGERLI